jgi:hypothetical protein
MIDPFTLVFNALWALADASKPLTGYLHSVTGDRVEPLVLPGNKIRFNLPENRDPQKATAADTDFPELMLTTTGLVEPNLGMSSCKTLIKRQYSWIITTGDYRMNYRLYPVQFALLCAMMDWDKVLTTLRWMEEPFILKLSLVQGVDAAQDPKVNRNIKGWSSIWACQVDMAFNSNQLRQFNSGE